MKLENKNIEVSLLAMTLGIFLFSQLSFAQEKNKWSGVDESVVEKFAAEYGRAARKPFINTDQGDLLLFVFLLAGTAGGFMMGYNFKKLFFKKANDA